MIELGRATSGLSAVLYVFLTLVLGMTLLRRQGVGMLARLREQAQGGLINPSWWLDDVALVGAGVLLIIPGMITDVLAIVFLIGPLRRGLGRLLGVKMVQAGRFTSADGAPENSEQVTLEGEFRRLDD